MLVVRINLLSNSLSKGYTGKLKGRAESRRKLVLTLWEDFRVPVETLPVKSFLIRFSLVEKLSKKGIGARTWEIGWIWVVSMDSGLIVCTFLGFYNRNGFSWREDWTRKTLPCPKQMNCKQLPSELDKINLKNSKSYSYLKRTDN